MESSIAFWALDPIPTIAITDAVPMTIAMVVKRDLNKFALIESKAVEIDSCIIMIYPKLLFTRSENFC